LKNLEIFTNPASGNVAIYIVARSGHKIIDLEEILLCKADRNYTIMLLEDGKNLNIPRSLCDLERVLKTHDFLRCSSSFLLNLHKHGAFHRRLKKIYLACYEVSVPKEKCREVFPVLTAFGFKELVKRYTDK
jgi:hypothetical protein